MADLDHMRKTYSGYKTEILIKDILVKSKDFTPEALSIIKEELQRRVGEITDFVKNEEQKSGVIEVEISNVRYWNLEEVMKKPVILGSLYLTSMGVYFIPSEWRKEIIPFGAFAYAMGSIGLIFDGFIAKLSEKKVNTAKYKSVPLSLIGECLESAYGKNIENIKSIKYRKSGYVDVVSDDNKPAGFSFDKTKIPMVVNWMNSHNISNTVYTSKGFLESILEIFH